MYKIFVSILFVCSISFHCFCAEDLYVFGIINNYNSGEAIEGATVTVYNGSRIIQSEETDMKGKFELFLGLDLDYKIEFTYINFVPKHLMIDARNIPEEEIRAGFSLGPMSINIFERIDGMDFSIFKNPIGKCHYDSVIKAPIWDEEYTTNEMKEIQHWMIKYEEIRLDKNAIEVNTKIIALLDKWHQAALNSDEETFLNSMTDDVVFLGTEKGDRWNKIRPEKWPASHENKNLLLSASERVIHHHDDNRLVWFEEVLETNAGNCRGSGVAELTDNGWKIKHYSLALLVDKK